MTVKKESQHDLSAVLFSSCLQRWILAFFSSRPVRVTSISIEKVHRPIWKVSQYAFTHHTLLLYRWIKKWHPGLISSDNLLSEAAPTSDFVDPLKILFAHLDPSVFHGLGKQARNPAGTETDELQILLDDAEDVGWWTVGAVCQFPDSRASVLLQQRLHLFHQTFSWMRTRPARMLFISQIGSSGAKRLQPALDCSQLCISPYRRGWRVRDREFGPIHFHSSTE